MPVDFMFEGEELVGLRQQLSLDPSSWPAATRYAVLALEAGRGHPAALWLSAAGAIHPNHYALLKPLQTLAAAYFAAGFFADASLSWARALRLSDGNEDNWINRGAALERLGRYSEARQSFRCALVIAPAGQTALYNLADIAFSEARWVEAIAVARRAGIDAAAITTAANALLRLGRPIEAAQHFRRALCLDPGMIGALSGMATAKMAEEDIASSGIWLRRCLVIRPDDVSVNNNLATWFLSQGNLRPGFALSEWRWLRPEAEQRRRGAAEWQGESIAERSILLYQEQGLGDALQMARYVPLLSKMKARVVIECHQALLRLFRSLSGDIELCLPGGSLQTDVQAPMMSLPRLFGTTLETIPGSVPYLFPEEKIVRQLAPKLASRKRRVGLVWQGNPRQVDEPHRSIPLSFLLPLLQRPDVTFYSLQRDHGRDQLAMLPDGVDIVDLGPDLSDLAVTAAVLSHLDLVITTCTAVAHLAGALGRPVWILLKRAPDWRWMLDREDSPWYPTARLLRQRRPGDWQEVSTRLSQTFTEWLQ